MAYPTLMAPLIKVERQKVYDPDTMMWVAMEQPSVGPISGSVTVVNMIPPVETGLAKEATLSALTTPSDQQHVIVDSSAAVAVTGPLTDVQLRATALPVTAASLPLTPASPAVATAATSSGQILAANLARTGLVLVNPNANRISLGFGVAAVLDSGITLMPYGGSYTMTPGTFCRSAIYAIAADADTGIGIQEFT